MSSPTLAEPREADATSDVVRVELPADARFLRIARLTASGLADEAGFDLDDVENLRIAADEAGGALIEVAAPDACVELAFRVGQGIVEFTGSVAASGPPSLHPLAKSVLEVLTRDLHLDHDQDRATITFRLGADPAEGSGAPS